MTPTLQPYFQNEHATVYHGDALKIVPNLEGRFNAIVTDPPYSSGGMFRGDRTQSAITKYVQEEHQYRYQNFSGDNRDQRGFFRWCVEWLIDLHAVAEDGALLLIFTDWRQLPTMTDAIQAGGWVWRAIMPWDKTEASRPQRGFYRSQCEYILVGVNGTLGRDTDRESDHYAPGIFRHPVTKADKHHPTGKPTALMRDVLRVLKPGSNILDMFGGSGTTAVAACELGHRCTVIEKDLHHCEVIRERLSHLQRDLVL